MSHILNLGTRQRQDGCQSWSGYGREEQNDASARSEALVVQLTTSYFTDHLTFSE
jgi:hypothetical protein